jgi:hypothetical protein
VLGELGKTQPALRKQIVRALVAATEVQDRVPDGGASVVVYDTNGVASLEPHRTPRLDGNTCLAAIRVLGQFGPDATEATPTLKKFKLGADAALRWAATEALEAIGKE